jgi:hypothetical protein
LQGFREGRAIGIGVEFRGGRENEIIQSLVRPPDNAALRRLVIRRAIATASTVAVDPSYIEALATSIAVKAATWVWNSKMVCNVPCAISG